MPGYLRMNTEGAIVSEPVNATDIAPVFSSMIRSDLMFPLPGICSAADRA